MKDSLKTQFVLCLVSAVFGAGFVAWLMYQNDGTFAKNVSKPNSLVSMPFLQDAVPSPVYSSDETTNIDVYETVNKVW